MVSFIDAHRDAHGVEPICDVLPIASSTYYDHLAKQANPTRPSARARRDEALRPEIRRVFEENWRAYGVRKVWRQLRREGFVVTRYTVARLMRDTGIQGIIRGKPHRTTRPDPALPCPLDKVNRQFRAPAPNQLWVSDFTSERWSLKSGHRAELAANHLTKPRRALRRRRGTAKSPRA